MGPVEVRLYQYCTGSQRGHYVYTLIANHELLRRSVSSAERLTSKQLLSLLAQQEAVSRDANCSGRFTFDAITGHTHLDTPQHVKLLPVLEIYPANDEDIAVFVQVLFELYTHTRSLELLQGINLDSFPKLKPWVLELIESATSTIDEFHQVLSALFPSDAAMWREARADFLHHQH